MGGCSIIVMGALIAAEAFIVVVAPFVYNKSILIGIIIIHAIHEYHSVVIILYVVFFYIQIYIQYSYGVQYIIHLHHRRGHNNIMNTSCSIAN